MSIRKITAKMSDQKKKSTKPSSSPLKRRPSSVRARLSLVRSLGLSSQNRPALRAATSLTARSPADRPTQALDGVGHRFVAGDLAEDLLEVRPSGVGLSPELVHRPERDERALVDDRDAVAHILGDFYCVRREEDRASVRHERSEEVLEQLCRARIEPDQRL